MRRLTLALALLLGSIHAVAQPTGPPADTPHTFSSGENQVALLELYTSEGCSSCPPAEAWFGKLLQSPDLWQRVVPIVFHVDYWDYLGWKDPFSSAENSQRQRRYQTEGGVRSVYTPGFVVNGNEWRGWFSDRPLPDSALPAGALNVVVEGGKIRASYLNEQTGAEPLELQVALLGFDMSTKVPAGENRGKTLTHHFVVLEHVRAHSDDGAWALNTPHSANEAPKQALAVWVTRPNRQQPLQATGGWLP